MNQSEETTGGVKNLIAFYEAMSSNDNSLTVLKKGKFIGKVPERVVESNLVDNTTITTNDDNNEDKNAEVADKVEANEEDVQKTKDSNTIEIQERKTESNGECKAISNKTISNEVPKTKEHNNEPKTDELNDEHKTIELNHEPKNNKHNNEPKSNDLNHECKSNELNKRTSDENENLNKSQSNNTIYIEEKFAPKTNRDKNNDKNENKLEEVKVNKTNNNQNHERTGIKETVNEKRPGDTKHIP
ncbi:hypothetical protein DMUE_4482 [Dictyocoela muelleri]|nr:hypothetical protein DMUE_4482 [Dictyocoela muelleri]